MKKTTDTDIFYISCGEAKSQTRHNIAFIMDGKEVGQLKVIDGKLTFEGCLDKSAKILFEYICRMFNK